MTQRLPLALLWLALLAPAFSYAESPPVPDWLPRTPLTDVLDGVSDTTDIVFVVDARVQPNVVLGQLEADQMTYSQLLTVLKNNEMAAVRMHDIVNIVPVNTVRQHPLPVLYEEDDSLAGDEWVTFVFRPERADPRRLVPILRPLLPQQGHFAAHPQSDSILIVDRYSNVKRVLSMVRRLDARSENDQSSDEPAAATASRD